MVAGLSAVPPNPPHMATHMATRPATGPGAAPGPALTVARAAALAGVNPRTIRKAISAGKLQATRDQAGAWQIEEHDARAYAETRSAQGPSRAADGPTGPGRSEGREGPLLVSALNELMIRHEAAAVRIGQLEAERERLQITAGESDALKDAARRAVSGSWRAKRAARDELRRLLG